VADEMYFVQLVTLNQLRNCIPTKDHRTAFTQLYQHKAIKYMQHFWSLYTNKCITLSLWNLLRLQ